MVASGMGEQNNLEPDQTDPTTGPIDGEDESAGDAEAGRSSAAPKGPLTPGQRLAAKKAQKATKKKEFKADLKQREEDAREKERAEANRIFQRNVKAEGLPEEVAKASSTFTDFMQRNRGRIVGALAAFVGVSALFLVAQRYLFTGSEEQAAKLAEALELAEAPIDADDADGKTDDGDVVFKTRADRAAKAAAAYEAAIKVDPDSKSAAWASLALAQLKLELD
jgi:hypothetical protein